MIQKNKEKKALQVIQDFLILGKIFSHQEKEYQFLFCFFDAIEILPWLIIENEDNTELFEITIRDICKEFECERIWTKYNEKEI